MRFYQWTKQRASVLARAFIFLLFFSGFVSAVFKFAESGRSMGDFYSGMAALPVFFTGGEGLLDVPAALKESVLQSVASPAECSDADECRIFCLGSEANKDACARYANELVAPVHARSILELAPREILEPLLARGSPPGGMKTFPDLLVYCGNPENDYSCEAFAERGRLFSYKDFDIKKIEAADRRLELEAMLEERAGARIFLDSDNDGISDYDEVNIYRSNPALRDSDSDGLGDREEIIAGADPAPKGENVFFENPNLGGVSYPGLFSIERVLALPSETSASESGIREVVFSGTGMPNGFLSFFIGDGSVQAGVQADSFGRFEHRLSRKLHFGEYTAYAALTNSEGKILAKSEPFIFVKTADSIEEKDFSPSPPAEEDSSLFEEHFILIFIGGALFIIGAVLLVRAIDSGEKDAAEPPMV
ncbi:hypothetical protein L0Y49_01415 [bacterium]|nr:hypothetical protein [bacterium]